MPGNFESDDADFDSQDQAETFDESMTVGGEGDSPLADDSPLAIGEDMRTFEEMPDVYDATRAEGDRDDEEARALDADEFDEDAIDDDDLEEDDELDYRAVTEQDEDDLDGQGGETGSGRFNEDAVSASDIEGLDEVEDADSVSGGEDDVSNFQARNVGDEDLKQMGYSEDRNGETRAKPDED